MRKIFFPISLILIVNNFGYSQNRIVQLFDEPVYQRDQFYFMMNERDSGTVVDLLDGIHNSKYYKDANESAKKYFTTDDFLDSCKEINVARIVILNKYFTFSNGKNETPSFEISGMLYGKSDKIEFHAQEIKTEKYNYLGYAKWFFTFENGHWNLVEVNM